jgi:alkylation response protein AidB-like acyl-CoA dehydrogenase
MLKTEHKQLLSFNYADHAEYEELLDALAKFMERRVAPSSAKFDTHEEAIGPTRAALLENGIAQISAPKKYGGLGLPFGVYEMAMELAATADASIALSVAIHNTVAEGVLQFGSEKLKDTFLPRIASGKTLGSFSLTEPTSGSDAKAIHTKATRRADEYILNGSKVLITNAGEADLYFVFASTDKGPSSFLVEKNRPGIQFGEDLPKLGMRGSRTSEVRFTDCRVPKEMLVGEEGKGFEYAKAMLNASRIVMGSICVGIAQAAFDKALVYSKQRKAFGSSISGFQLTREKIADMKTMIAAGRLLCMHASRLRESGAEFASEASQAKVFSTEMSLEVCDAAIQIFGGYGYTTDDVHRDWRDARLLTIGEGTSEVLRLLFASRDVARLR